MATRKPKAPNTPATVSGIPVDRLDEKGLASEYGYALSIINADPDIKNLFYTALNDKKGQWDPKKFAAQLQNTNWYKNNNQYAREALIAQASGGADWDAQVQNATIAVNSAATKIGARLSQPQVDSLAKRYLLEGWGQNNRDQLLLTAISGSIDTGPSASGKSNNLRGASGNLADTLRTLAEDNGMTFSDSYYVGAARSVAAGLTTADDWNRDVTDQAASMWPIYSDKIKAGSSAKQLASGYINTMAQELDLLPDQISLNDPYIKQALTGIDEQGNPKPTSLWDFRTKLRNDPRWLNTIAAQNNIADVSNSILKTFGLAG